MTAECVAHDRFLVVARVDLFEDHGFDRVPQLGRWVWLVRRTVAPPAG